MKSDDRQNGAPADNAISADLVFALHARVATTTISPAADVLGEGVAATLGEGRGISDGAITLSAFLPEERQLLALTDGHRSVAELIRLSGLSKAVAHKHLASLRDRGIVVGLTSRELDGGASGPPSPEESERAAEAEAAAEGSSALTKAIDEYLELAASALTSAAEEASEAARAGTGEADQAAASAQGPLPGMIPDAAAGSAPAPAAASPSFPEPPSFGNFGNPGSQGQPFRPNVTAFWIPALADLPLKADDSASSSADGVPQAGTSGAGSGSTSAPTVVVTGSSGRTEASKPNPSAAVTVASSAAPHADGVPQTAVPFVSAPIPFRVGNYEVATRIAQGGMGSIYVCRRTGDAGYQRLFTLKVVRQHSAQREEAVQSFKREAHVGSLLSHPNLQTVLDVGSYKDQPFLVLDYIEGTSLSELMSDDRRAPVPVVVAMLLDVLRGLHHAHQLVDDKGAPLGLVHGDVSPQNVLVGVDGAARLTDFGSATFTGEGRLHDPKWKATGKPAYMAPEQLRAEPLDARTDVFAVGVLLWSALTGQKLFAGDTYDETIIKVLRKKIAPPSAFGAPASFDDVCLKALSRSREGRFGNADEMARDLQRVASNQNLLASAADVGQWVRRESGEALGEQRRRIHLMFGVSKMPPARVDSSTAPKPPPKASPATVVLGTAHRNLHTPKLGANKTLPSRTVLLPALQRQPKTFWQTWNVVIVSALLALPVTLTIGYFVSNLFVSPPEPARPLPANTADAASPAG